MERAKSSLRLGINPSVLEKSILNPVSLYSLLCFPSNTTWILSALAVRLLEDDVAYLIECNTSQNMMAFDGRLFENPTL